jgi:hypothetical protein
MTQTVRQTPAHDRRRGQSSMVLDVELDVLVDDVEPVLDVLVDDDEP